MFRILRSSVSGVVCLIPLYLFGCPRECFPFATRVLIDCFGLVK
jgi:hypothetical protein